MDVDFLILILGFFSVPILMGYMLIWAIQNGYFQGTSCITLPEEEEQDIIEEEDEQ